SARSTGAAMRSARGTAFVSFIRALRFGSCAGRQTREPLPVGRERRRDAKGIAAGKRLIDRDRIEHAAGPRPHDGDSRRQEYGLGDAVRNEYDGEALDLPQFGELVV